MREHAVVLAVRRLVSDATGAAGRADVRAADDGEPRVKLQRSAAQIQRGNEREQVVTAGARGTHRPDRVLLVEQVRVRAGDALDDHEVALFKRVHPPGANFGIRRLSHAAVRGAVGHGRFGDRVDVALEPPHRAPAVVDVVQILVPRVGLHRVLNRAPLVVLPKRLLLAKSAADEGGVPVHRASLEVVPGVQEQLRGTGHLHSLVEGDEEVNLIALLVRPIALGDQRMRVSGGGRLELGDVRAAHVPFLLTGGEIARRNDGEVVHVGAHAENLEHLVVKVRSVVAEDAAEGDVIAVSQRVRPDDVHVSAAGCTLRGAAGVARGHGVRFGAAGEVGRLELVPVLVVLEPSVR